MRRLDDIAQPVIDRAAKKPGDPFVVIQEAILRHDRMREMLVIEAIGTCAVRITSSTVTCEPQRYVDQHFAAVIWSTK